MDPNAHNKNRNAVPFEELAKFEGQHIAWSLDGTHILAGDEDPSALVDRLKIVGYQPGSYVLSFVDFNSYLGGVVFNDGSWGSDK